MNGGTNATRVNADAAITTNGLGRRYGSTWALRDCTLTVPRGKVAALVGPNGAGKTTLLHLLVGLLQPTAGSAALFGASPHHAPQTVLAHTGFVAQDHPLYSDFSVAEMLTLGRKLNPRWDDAAGRARLQRLGIPLGRRVGTLSGGQRAQVALALALAKQPDLVVLDEPVASLDPLARRDFLRALADAAGTGALTVLLSSHIIGDLEQVCDYLIILSASRVQLAGDIAEIAAGHRILSGPRSDVGRGAAALDVIETTTERDRAHLLARLRPTDAPPSGWEVREPTLEEIVLAYLGRTEGAEANVAAMPALAEWRSGEVAR